MVFLFYDDRFTDGYFTDGYTMDDLFLDGLFLMATFLVVTLLTVTLWPTSRILCVCSFSRQWTLWHSIAPGWKMRISQRRYGSLCSAGVLLAG